MHGGEHDDDGELADGNEVDGEHADDNEGGESAGSATVTLVDDTEEEGVADVSHEVRGLGDRESRVRSPGSLDVGGGLGAVSPIAGKTMPLLGAPQRVLKNLDSARSTYPASGIEHGNLSWPTADRSDDGTPGGTLSDDGSPGGTLSDDGTPGGTLSYDGTPGGTLPRADQEDRELTDGMSGKDVRVDAVHFAAEYMRLRRVLVQQGTSCDEYTLDAVTRIVARAGVKSLAQAQDEGQPAGEIMKMYQDVLMDLLIEYNQPDTEQGMDGIRAETQRRVEYVSGLLAQHVEEHVVSVVLHTVTKLSCRSEDIGHGEYGHVHDALGCAECKAMLGRAMTGLQKRTGEELTRWEQRVLADRAVISDLRKESQEQVKTQAELQARLAAMALRVEGFLRVKQDEVVAKSSSPSNSRGCLQYAGADSQVTMLSSGGGSMAASMTDSWSKRATGPQTTTGYGGFSPTVVLDQSTDRQNALVHQLAAEQVKSRKLEESLLQAQDVSHGASMEYVTQDGEARVTCERALNAISLIFQSREQSMAALRRVEHLARVVRTRMDGQGSSYQDTGREATDDELIQMIQSTHATGGIGGALYKERSQIESALKAVVTDLRMVHEKWYAVIYSGHYGAKGKNMALITGVDVGMPTDSEICGAPSVQIAVKIGRALDHILGAYQDGFATILPIVKLAVELRTGFSMPTLESVRDGEAVWQLSDDVTELRTTYVEETMRLFAMLQKMIPKAVQKTNDPLKLGIETLNPYWVHSPNLSKCGVSSVIWLLFYHRQGGRLQRRAYERVFLKFPPMFATMGVVAAVQKMRSMLEAMFWLDVVVGFIDSISPMYVVLNEVHPLFGTLLRKYAEYETCSQDVNYDNVLYPHTNSGFVIFMGDVMAVQERITTADTGASTGVKEPSLVMANAAAEFYHAEEELVRACAGYNGGVGEEMAGAASGGGRLTGLETRTCFWCKKPGHIKRDCAEFKKAGGNGGGGGGSRGGGGRESASAAGGFQGVCYQCNVKGHRKSDCPMNKETAAATDWGAEMGSLSCKACGKGILKGIEQHFTKRGMAAPKLCQDDFATFKANKSIQLLDKSTLVWRATRETKKKKLETAAETTITEDVDEMEELLSCAEDQEAATAGACGAGEQGTFRKLARQPLWHSD